MDAFIKPDIQKTIKRLSHQKNHEVLKNKLRSWIITRELSVTDLIRACREKTINVSPGVLNKLGILYGSGKEGLNEEPETAFVFYLAAADLGYASAAGNVAQYYFDGRAPGGKNIDAAYEFCHKAVEGGADKFMLLSEILHEKRDYHETVRCLRKIVESKKLSDGLAKKRIDARKLEIQCLFKILDQLFDKVSLSDALLTETIEERSYVGGSTPNLTSLMVQTSMGSPSIQPFSPQPMTNSPAALTPKTPTASSSTPLLRRAIGSPVVIPSPRPTSAPLALSQSFSINSGPTSNLQSAYKSLLSELRPPAPPSISRGLKSAYQNPELLQHHLPGWFYISSDLEGFDMTACSQLTARAQVLELEAEALRSAYETAEARVSLGKQHKFSDEVISALMKNKVHEFQDLYHSLQMNKANLLQTWNYFTDTAEHLLRRQIVAEKRYFDPSNTTNPLILRLARELLHRRLYDYPEYLDADWNAYYIPENHLNTPLHLSNLNPVAYRIPSARVLLTAERSLLEISMRTYGRSRSVHRCQQTGWTGQLNLSVCPSAVALGGDASNTAGGSSGSKISSTQLLQEVTYQETVVIGSSVIRYQHHTFPHIPPPTPPVNKLAVHEVDRHGKKQKEGFQSIYPTIDHAFSQEDLAPFDAYYHMMDLACSDDILRFLNHFTLMDEDKLHYQENEKKVVDLILKFLREGRPFNLVDLRVINEDASEQDCTMMTRIVYHYFIKRLVPWILSTWAREEQDSVVEYYSDFDLPLASAQARALHLIAAGFLTFSEVFQLHSPYGIFYFTDSNHIERMHESPAEKKERKQSYCHLRQQIINLNGLYQKAILEHQQSNFHPYVFFWKNHPQGSTIATYRRLFQELVDVYGEPDDAIEDVEERYGSDDRELDYLMSKLKI